MSSDTQLERVKVKHDKLIILAYSKFTADLNRRLSEEKKGTLQSLVGVEENVCKLSKIFESFNFTVYSSLNATFAGTERFVQENLEDINKSEYDCLAVCVSTHGGDGFFYCTDEVYETAKLFDYFEAQACAKLARKPKLFFIDTCQGDKIDFRYPFMGPTSGKDYYDIPLCADYLMAHPSYKGFVSTYDSKGSYFVQEMYSVFNQHYRTHDLFQLLTMVGKNVATKIRTTFNTKSELGYCKQMPYFKSSLQCLVMFGRTKPNTIYTEFNETIEYFDVNQKLNSNKVVLIERAMLAPNLVDSMKTSFTSDPIAIECTNLEIANFMFLYLKQGDVNLLNLINLNQHAPGLLAIACKYGMQDLKKWCEDALFARLAPETAVNILKLSDDCESLDLKNKTIKYILTNRQIIKQSDFIRLTNSRQELLSEMRTIKININNFRIK